MDARERPARNRRPTEHFTVASERQQGFKEYGAADQARRADCRGQRQEVVPAFHRGAAAAPRGRGGRSATRDQSLVRSKCAQQVAAVCQGENTTPACAQPKLESPPGASQVRFERSGRGRSG